jgi:hypothetical protein
MIGTYKTSRRRIGCWYTDGSHLRGVIREGVAGSLCRLMSKGGRKPLRTFTSVDGRVWEGGKCNHFDPPQLQKSCTGWSREVMKGPSWTSSWGGWVHLPVLDHQGSRGPRLFRHGHIGHATTIENAEAQPAGVPCCRPACNAIAIRIAAGAKPKQPVSVVMNSQGRSSYRTINPTLKDLLVMWSSPVKSELLIGTAPTDRLLRKVWNIQGKRRLARWRPSDLIGLAGPMKQP